MIVISLIKYALFVFAAWLCVLNFYLCFLRYPLYLRSGKPKESYKFISGIPVFGSLILYLLVRYTNLPSPVFYAGVVLIIIDTGGLHWALGNIIYHAFLHFKKKIAP